jgi:hypothetical protein
MKKKHTEMVVGAGFYRREQWPLLLETAEDRAELEDTYEEWLESFWKGIRNLRTLGIEPLKVDVDLEELLACCKARD